MRVEVLRPASTQLLRSIMYPLLIAIVLVQFLFLVAVLSGQVK